MGLRTGPHARIPGTHSQLVVGPWPHAPKDGRPGVAERPTPDAQAEVPPPGHPHAAPTARKASLQERARWGW